MTQDEEQVFRELWGNGTKAGDIARQLCVSERSVHKTAKRFGMRRRVPANWTDEANQALRDMWLTHTTQQIADHLKITRNAVCGRADRVGLTKPKKASRTPARVPRIRTRKVASLPKSEPVLIEPIRVALTRLQADQCRWPLGHPGDADFSFCGHPTAVRSYCAGHAKVAYRRRGT